MKKIKLNKHIINKVNKAIEDMFLNGIIESNVIPKKTGVYAPWSNASNILSRREAESYRRFLLDAMQYGILIAFYDENSTLWYIAANNYNEFQSQVKEAYNQC